MKYYVIEPHVDGTKKYSPGDQREADENEVQHLVKLGVLSTEKPAVKSKAPEPEKKAV